MTTENRFVGHAAVHDNAKPDEWVVETFGNQGITFQRATFTGTMAQERAMAYLHWLESRAGVDV
jgi:hypothetical protein